MVDYLSIPECHHRKIYRLKSRNLPVGIWNSDTKAFVGIREKLSTEFLDSEYHWDTGHEHGTAKPYEVVGELEPEFAVWERYPQVTCMNCGMAVEYIPRPPSSAGHFHAGEWVHMDGQEEAWSQPWCKVVRPLQAPYTPARLALIAVEIQLGLRKSFDGRIPHGS